MRKCQRLEAHLKQKIEKQKATLANLEKVSWAATWNSGCFTGPVRRNQWINMPVKSCWHKLRAQLLTLNIKR